ncbi:hypothetical protein [Rickettsia endosymbiont of Nabis limbatus]
MKRVWQHKQKIIKGFAMKYNLDKLVYFEQFNDTPRSRATRYLSKKF